MTNPRFDCFKWNSICQTTSAVVRQTKTTLKAVLRADSEESAVVRQPPHGVAHRSPGCAFESARALYAARGSGAHTREGDRQRLVTDGGTDTESERVTVRVDDPEIVAALNDAENKSEATRQALRETYGGNAERNDDDLTTSARDAYQRLVELVGREAEIDEASALSLVAQELQVEKQAVKGSVMKELRSAGYLTVRGSTVVVHQEPGAHYDDADGHHDIVSFESSIAPTTRYGCLRCEREAGRKKHIKTRPCEIVTPEQRTATRRHRRGGAGR